MKGFFSIALLFTTATILAQSGKIDSLKATLRSADSLASVELQTEIAKLYLQSDIDSALHWIDQSIKYARTDSCTLFRQWRRMGQFLNGAGRHNEALSALVQAQIVGENCKAILDHILVRNNLGIVYMVRGNFSKAFDLHFENLVAYRSVNDEVNIAVTYNNIGVLYYQVGNHAKALEYFKKSLFLDTMIGEHFGRGYSLSNIAICYAHLGVIGESTKYLELMRQYPGGVYGNDLISMRFIEGVLEKKAGLLDMSEASFRESLELSRRAGHVRFICYNVQELGLVLVAQGRYREAERLLKDTEALAREHHLEQILYGVVSQLALLYRATGDVPELADYQQKQIDQMKVISTQNKAKAAANAQAYALEEEYLATIKAQRALIATNDLLAEQQRTIYTVSLTLLASVILMLLMFFKSYVLQSKHKRILKTRIAERKLKVAQENAERKEQLSQMEMVLGNVLALDLSTGI